MLRKQNFPDIICRDTYVGYTIYIVVHMLKYGVRTIQLHITLYIQVDLRKIIATSHTSEYSIIL